MSLAVSTTGISPTHHRYGSNPSSLSSGSSPVSSSLRAPPLFPPGLGPALPPDIANAWGGLSRNVSSASSTSSHTPPGLDRDTNFSAASTASESSVAFVDSNEVKDSEIDGPLEGTIYVAVTESMEDGLYKMGLNDVDYVAPWEEQKEEFIDFDNIPDYSKHEPAVVPEPLKCPAHGAICKKGICAAYADMLKAEKRKEEAAKRAGKGGANSGKGRGGGGRFEKGVSKERNNGSNRGGSTFTSSIHRTLILIYFQNLQMAAVLGATEVGPTADHLRTPGEARVQM